MKAALHREYWKEKKIDFEVAKSVACRAILTSLVVKDEGEIRKGSIGLTRIP